MHYIGLGCRRQCSLAGLPLPVAARRPRPPLASEPRACQSECRWSAAEMLSDRDSRPGPARTRCQTECYEPGPATVTVPRRRPRQACCFPGPESLMLSAWTRA